MLPLFPDEEPITLLKCDSEYSSDWQGQYYNADWSDITICLDYPEQQVKAYFGELLNRHVLNKIDCFLKAERLNIDLAVWLEPCVKGFLLPVKPLFLVELKRRDGQAFENTKTQMNGYIKNNLPIGGCLFYNTKVLFHVNGTDESQIHTIDEFIRFVNSVYSTVQNKLKPLIELFVSGQQGNYEAFLRLVKGIKSSDVFFNSPKFLVEIHNGNPLLLVDPYFEETGTQLCYAENYKERVFDGNKFKALWYVE